MTTNLILKKTINGMTSITLNRPEKRNALNAQMIDELLIVLNETANDGETRVLIMSGNGEHFCAGADMAYMEQLGQCTEAENRADAEKIAMLMKQLYVFPHPTILLAHGATMGGGLGLLAASDIAIGAKNAVFSFSEVKIGLAPSTISPYVVAAIGERMARYYFLTGERFGADIAHRIGLLHEVTEPDALTSVGITVAEKLLQNSPYAMSAVKKLIPLLQQPMSDELSQMTIDHLAKLRASAQAQEGLRAFLEKRTPTWK
jgi:methylglutaconyl-CoA hydratase